MGGDWIRVYGWRLFTIRIGWYFFIGNRYQQSQRNHEIHILTAELVMAWNRKLPPSRRLSKSPACRSKLLLWSAISRIFFDCKVKSAAAPTCRYRARIGRKMAADAIANSVRNIDYPNFKSEVAAHARRDVYMDVWKAMYTFQHKMDRGPAPSQKHTPI
jgi:hypothetical protein